MASTNQEDQFLAYDECERKHIRMKDRTFFAAWEIIGRDDPFCQSWTHVGCNQQDYIIEHL